jgi:hypothetical protein
MIDVNIHIRSDAQIAGEFLQSFGRRAEIGVKRALRRSLNGMPRDAFGALKEQYNVKAGDVRKSFRSYIWGNPPVGQGTFTGRPVPLVRFAPRPAGITQRRPAAGVSVMVKAQRKAISGAFIARVAPRVGNTFTQRSAQIVSRGRAGHIGVFQRRGRKRLPIKELYGPSLARMLDNPEVNEQIRRRAAERFETALRHEIGYLIKQGVR